MAEYQNRQPAFGPAGRSIVESMPVGVVVFDTHLRIVEANSQAASLLELSDTISKSLANGTDEKMRQGWEQQMQTVISQGRKISFDNINYLHNGRSRLLQIICSAVTAADTGNIIGGAAVIQDVTEKIDTERRLVAAEKLAALGKLSSKVAHELNNPMDGILRYLNLAIRTVAQNKTEKVEDYLKQCRTALMRMMQIVGELLEFSRSRHVPLEDAKVEQIIDDAIKAMAVSAQAAGVEIISNCAPAIPRIKGGGLFQVFCNLIKNAINAMPRGGRLLISAALQHNNIVIEFRDSGTGFKPEHEKLLFEPFFTTNTKGKGTGLGLAICKDIVEKYNGRITAQNNPAGGSTFTVFLPVPNEL